MSITTIGIDIAKHVFHVCGATPSGRVVMRKRLYRGELLDFMRNQTACVVGIEACAGSHYWGRELNTMGHVVKLMPPQYVKPYVKTNKNDTNDAEACCEAVTRPTMRFVAVKSVGQQEMNQIHRVRERLIRARTALSNEARGFLGEFGIIIPQGNKSLVAKVSEVLIGQTDRLPALSREIVARMLDEFSRLQEEIEFYEKRISSIHKAHPLSNRLATLPGVGEISATAVVAAVSDPTQFKSGRQFAAFLGLPPRQHSTGGKTKLGTMSKRGDPYIRKLLIQGAHAVMRHVGKKKDHRSLWIQQLIARRGKCRAAVAIANKNARIMWVLMARGGIYECDYGRVA